MKVDRPRQLAVEALDRIEDSDAYANLLLPAHLSALPAQLDRNFATELVYGTLRMRRACDWLVDRFSRLAPGLPVTADIEAGGGQFLVILSTARR